MKTFGAYWVRREVGDWRLGRRAGAAIARRNLLSKWNSKIEPSITGGRGATAECLVMVTAVGRGLSAADR